MQKSQNTPQPIIKWAGGKRQLVPIITELAPQNYNRYYEPFFGGGAVFCALSPAKATINDINKQLIGMYKQIKADPNAICAALSDLQGQYNAKKTMTAKDKLYYEFRQSFNDYLKRDDDIKYPLPAALLILLNKTGFNGLYRVNAQGEYNVPTSHKKHINIYDDDNIHALSRLLHKAKIMSKDFEKACADATAGDFVFFDSPYYGTFDKYQKNGFSDDDHIRLAKLFQKLTDNGVYCMLTNNNCDFIKNLYKKHKIRTVDVKRMINRNGNDRTGQEIIVTNY